eukprot:Gb_38131 [translate_table: standard]
MVIVIRNDICLLYDSAEVKPSYYIEEDAVACLERDACRTRSGITTEEEECSSLYVTRDIWYHVVLLDLIQKIQLMDLGYVQHSKPDCDDKEICVAVAKWLRPQRSGTEKSTYEEGAFVFASVASTICSLVSARDHRIEFILGYREAFTLIRGILASKLNAENDYSIVKSGQKFKNCETEYDMSYMIKNNQDMEEKVFDVKSKTFYVVRDAGKLLARVEFALPTMDVDEVAIGYDM